MTVDDNQTEDEQQHQSNNHCDTCNMLQLVVRFKDIPLRADDGYTPTCVFKRFIEDVAWFTVDFYDAMACLASYHGLTNAGKNGVLLCHGSCEDSFIKQLRGVGMYQIGTALA